MVLFGKCRFPSVADRSQRRKEERRGLKTFCRKYGPFLLHITHFPIEDISDSKYLDSDFKVSD